MSFTDKTMVLYRGSLKSCNYHCSYCPFSKHKGSEKEYEKDRQQWERFVESVLERKSLGIRALMVVPYGEALIHSWYWKGLGRLATSDSIDAVGAQTNLSFSIEQSLEEYEKAGGKTEKLRLWATFHPQMTEAEQFADKCRRLWREGVSLCAGAVGDPRQTEAIRHLRTLLPKDIYLWVNKMDGLKRCYTKEEQTALEEIDPFFLRELIPVKADPGQCRGRIFVEGDGKIHSCNISPVREENWYGPWEHILEAPPRCSRKLCSCYLAYGGRSDVMNRILFGHYPLFRIPQKRKAVFLDIDKTLIPHKKDAPKAEGRIPEHTKLDLELLKRQGTKLFFATSRPYEDAARQCREIWHLFEGGVFGCGSHVLWKREDKVKEKLYPITEEWCPHLKTLGEQSGSRVLIYKRGYITYKITFLRRGNQIWQQEEAENIIRQCPAASQGKIRVITEEHCLQIISADASKAEGVKVLCSWIGIPPSNTAAAGDSSEDEEMIKLCTAKE